MKLSPIEKRFVLITLFGIFLLFGILVEKRYGTFQGSSSSGTKTIVEVETVEFPIDVNKASKEELMKLPGIGPVKAEAIIEYRETFGPFTSVEDLLKVSGIGEKTLEKIRKYVKVEGVGEVVKGSGRINVNTASLEELMELPGIGEVKAKRIMENRPYSKLEDLLKVPGIGEKTLERIKNLVSF